MIFSWEVSGVRTGFRVSFSPRFMVWEERRPVIFSVLTMDFCTVTLMYAFLPLLSVTVILVLPARFPVILPLESTVAIFRLEEVQERMESPLASPLTFTRAVVCFTRNLIFVVLSRIVGVSFLPTVLV